MDEASRSRRALMLLLAIAAGISVANLYYAQPLAAQMATSLGVLPGAIGSALVATQVGYALGMIVMVPLGDGRERRALITTTILASVPALVGLACAPSVPLLTVASLLVGVASSVPQMILPYAVELAPIEERGHVVGTIMSGLLIGILLSRTVAGALGEWLGWRAMFALAAVAMVGLVVMLRRVLPAQVPPTRLPWATTVRSLWAVWREQPVLRRRAVVGGLGFAAFSVFWSTLSFQLGTLGHGSAAAGTFGVIGIAGVLVAPMAARRATVASPSRLNVLALIATAASFGVFVLGAESLVLIALGVVLLDAGAQANHLTNQTVIFGLAPALRSRINALYMVGYFAGGALGTALAATAWSLGGWPAVCVTGGVLALLGIVPLLGER